MVFGSQINDQAMINRKVDRLGFEDVCFSDLVSVTIMGKAELNETDEI